jgi:hypothetical protein
MRAKQRPNRNARYKYQGLISSAGRSFPGEGGVTEELKVRKGAGVQLLHDVTLAWGFENGWSRWMTTGTASSEESIRR